MALQKIKRIKEYIKEKYDGTDELHIEEEVEKKAPENEDKEKEEKGDEDECGDGFVIQQLDRKQKHIDRTNIIGDAEILFGTGLGLIGGGLLFTPFAPAGAVIASLGSYLGLKGFSMDVGAAVANYAITKNAISQFDEDMKESGIDRPGLSEIWRKICACAQDNDACVDIDYKSELAEEFMNEVKKWLVPEYLKRKRKYMRKEIKINFEVQEQIKWYQFWRKEDEEEKIRKNLIELIDFIVNYWLERIYEDAYLWTVMNNNDQLKSIKTMKEMPADDEDISNNNIDISQDHGDDRFTYKEEKTHINVDGHSYQFDHKTFQLNDIKIMQEISPSSETVENNIVENNTRKMIKNSESKQPSVDNMTTTRALSVTEKTTNKKYLLPVGTTSLKNITAESLVTSFTFQIAVLSILPIDFIFSSLTLAFNVSSAQKGSLNQQERTLVTMMQQIDLACEMANFVVEMLPKT